MDFNQGTCPGTGLTYRQPGAGRRGAGLTYRKRHGAGAINGNGAPGDYDPYEIGGPMGPDMVGIGMNVAAAGLALLAQYFVIKWAIKGARKK